MFQIAGGIALFFVGLVLLALLAGLVVRIYFAVGDALRWLASPVRRLIYGYWVP